MFSNLIKRIININEEIPLLEYLLIKIKIKTNNLVQRENFFRAYKTFRINQDLNADKITIDVVIMCLEKDIETLKLCIKSCREFLNHEISKLYLVSPLSEKIKKLSEKEGCININENTIIEIKKSDIKYNVNGIERNGWVFQQLLKLHVDKISKSKYIFTIDSDTILTQPKTLVHNQKIIFDFSNEFHKPYFELYEKLTKFKHNLSVSLVAHMMTFEREKLLLLRKHVNYENNDTFINSILKNLNTNEISSLSEYELYGNYVVKKFEKEYLFRYWFNLSILNLDNFKKINLKGYSSVSRHIHK